MSAFNTDASTLPGIDVSVVIPWSNRPELEITLAKNSAAFSAVHSEVLVVNCGGDKQMLERILKSSPFGSVRCIDIPHHTFNKCLALNIGACSSCADRLFFLDADVILAPDFLASAIDCTKDDSFVTIEWVVDSNALAKSSGLVESIHTIEFVWDSGRRTAFEFYRKRVTDQARGGQGLICLLKKHFNQVQGMNSALIGWGGEDLDLIVRLLVLLEIQRVNLGEAIHLYHDDSVRQLTGKTRNPSFQTNMAICQANYANGRFLGTLDRDLLEWKDKIQELSCDRAEMAG
jgi:predicted glycosyltransferase involved in capsule biosynthesis